MTLLRVSFALVILLFSCVVWTDETWEDVALEDALFNSPDAPPAPLVYQANKTEANKLGAVPLDGRSLVDSWLGKRQRTCVNVGYSPCASSYGCCPTGDKCCTLGCCGSSQSCCRGNFCADAGEKCCTFGTCPSGWNCCAAGTCYPEGGECCSNGNYCSPGNQCYRVNGSPRCCTNSRCTAHVSSGVTVTAGGNQLSPSRTRSIAVSVPTSPSTTDKPDAPDAPESSPSDSTPPTVAGSSASSSTPAPTPAPTGAASFQYYYFTITWWYYSYFYTYSTFSTRTFTGSSSSRIETSTVFSVYETDSASARSSFRAVSATFSSPTPAAATQLSSLPPATDILPVPSFSGPSAGSATGSAVSGGGPGSGGASGASQLSANWGLPGGLIGFALASLISGFLMIWL